MGEDPECGGGGKREFVGLRCCTGVMGGSSVFE